MGEFGGTPSFLYVFLRYYNFPGSSRLLCILLDCSVMLSLW